MSSTGPPSLTRTVLRGARLTSSGFFLSQTMTLGVYLVLARTATPSEFGQYAAGTIFVNVGYLLAGSGMGPAVIQRRDRVEEAASTALIATTLFGLGAALLALALAPVVGLYFDSSVIGWVAAASAGLLVLRGVAVVPNALMERRFSFLRRAILDPASAVAFGVTAIATTAAGLGVWGLVAGTYAAALVDGLGPWALARWRPRFRGVSFGLWRELAGYGRHILVAALVMHASGVLDRAVLGRFVGTAAVGQYRYARRLGVQPLATIVDVVSHVLFPAFARLADDRPRFQRAFLRSLRWTTAIGFPLSFVLLPLGLPIAVLLFGDPWRPAGEALMALSAFSAAMVIGSIASETWKAAGRTALLPRMHLIGLVASAVFMIALLPFGLVGVAGGVSAGAVVLAGYALVQTSKVIELPLGALVRELLPPTTASLVMVALLTPLEHAVLHAADRSTLPGLGLLAAESLLALAVYAVTLLALSPALREEAGRRAWPRPTLAARG